MKALYLALGRLDLRLTAWLERGRRALLEARHPRLRLAPGARLEPGTTT